MANHPTPPTTPPQGWQPQICYGRSFSVCVCVNPDAGRPFIAQNAKRRQYICWQPLAFSGRALLH